MLEGHVLVSAECLSAKRALKAGESGTFSCVSEPVAESTPMPPPTATPPSPVAAVAAMSARPVQSHPGTSSVSPSVELPAMRAPGWRELSASGDYAGSLAAAEAQGFERLCEMLPSSELLELASTARLAGRFERANTGYAAVRRRFAGSENAASAAFHLGQLAFDGSHDYRAARRSFAAYLSECQGCALAPEALGRRMEAEQRLGELELARASASLYLERYPKGAHARLAQSLKEP